MGDNDRQTALTPRQLRFVAALLEAGTIREAAKTAGLGESTAWRYLADAAVKAEIARRADGLLTHSSASVFADMAEARAVLVTVMRDPCAGNSARIAAARLISDAGVQLF